jgi:hypothetical protein
MDFSASAPGLIRFEIFEGRRGPGGPSNGLAPDFVCDPRLGGSAVGEKTLNIDCIEVPAVGTNALRNPPYDMREDQRQARPPRC